MKFTLFIVCFLYVSFNDAKVYFSFLLKTESTFATKKMI